MKKEEALAKVAEAMDEANEDYMVTVQNEFGLNGEKITTIWVEQGEEVEELKDDEEKVSTG